MQAHRAAPRPSLSTSLTVGCIVEIWSKRARTHCPMLYVVSTADVRCADGAGHSGAIGDVQNPGGLHRGAVVRVMEVLRNSLPHTMAASGSPNGSLPRHTARPCASPCRGSHCTAASLLVPSLAVVGSSGRFGYSIDRLFQGLRISPKLRLQPFLGSGDCLIHPLLDVRCCDHQQPTAARVE